jgi:hypothetical protein
VLMLLASASDLKGELIVAWHRRFRPRLPTAEVRVQSQVWSRVISEGRSDTGGSFSVSTAAATTIITKTNFHLLHFFFLCPFSLLLYRSPLNLSVLKHLPLTSFNNTTGTMVHSGS